MNRISCMSNLNIYKSPIVPLWDPYAQYLVMCGIDLVLLLLLLTFYDPLLSHSLVLIRTITAPGIPVRRNIYLPKSTSLRQLYSAIDTIFSPRTSIVICRFSGFTAWSVTFEARIFHYTNDIGFPRPHSEQDSYTLIG